MFSSERSVEIKCYNEKGQLEVDYVAIQMDQVDERSGLVGITRVREISGNIAIIDINDGQDNSTFRIPIKDLVELVPN